MNTRQFNLKSIRPEVLSATINDFMSIDERFQNLVLRPIIKLQSDFILEVFKNYASKHKKVFYDLPLENRIKYIENAIQKDIKFRNSLKGIIIGHFTIEEYKLYTQNSSALNKRMMGIVTENLLSNIQLLENPELLAAV